MRLYLVRHARPVVPQGVCYGSTNLAVDPDHQQSVLMHLMSILPARTPVFSSPLQRCRSLATGLALALDSGEPAFDARLAEMDFGTWEMQAWDAIPRVEIDAWAADLATYRPGGGECLLDVARRVRSFREDLCARELDCVVVVAHAGTIRLLLAAQQVDSPEEMVAFAARTSNSIAYGELTIIDC
jgi:alpha-ribazole phosphatase